ncbi:MAG: S1 RNA-binding domain-containing protein [Candidatus Aminicenantes bacterium]
MSHIEFDSGVDEQNEIWRSIQKASVIIANITGFKPDVMLELGVALMKKGHVFLMAEKSLDGKKNLPVNINNLKVEFYESDKLDEFSDLLLNQVEKWITPDEIKIKNADVRKLMTDVLALRKEKKYDTALLLFGSMDKDEPGNWFIYKEWGITYKESKDYNNAIKKLQQALDCARLNTHKSEIYAEFGVIYSQINMVDDALVAFEKAENLDQDNAVLYEKWAFLYYKLGKHHYAMNKMMMAVKLDEKNEVYRWKFEFYSKKFADNNFTMGLGKWLEEKQTRDRCPTTLPSRFRGSKQEDYLRFKKKHSTQEVLEGTILQIRPRLGIFVRLDYNITGLIFARTLPRNFDVNQKFQVGQKIKVIYKSYNDEKYQIGLDIANGLASSKEPPKAPPPKAPPPEPPEPATHHESKEMPSPIRDDKRMKRQDKEIEAFLEKEEDNLQKIVDDEFEKLQKGQLKLFSPKYMRVGDPQDACALISRESIKKKIDRRTLKDLESDITKDLNWTEEPQKEEIEIEISHEMKAVLSGDDFKIDLKTGEEEQLIKPTGYTVWIWDITPLKAGRKVIHLSISVILYIEKLGEKKYSRPVIERDIKVKVNLIYGIQKNWKWIVGTIITLLGTTIALLSLLK